MIYIIIILILIIIALFFVIKDKDKQIDHLSKKFWKERKRNNDLSDNDISQQKYIKELEVKVKYYHDAYYKSEEVRKKLYAERKQ